MEKGQPLIVTNSSLATFRACPRRYWFQYGLNRVRVTEAPALSFGRVMHDALEVFWTMGAKAMVVWLSQNASTMDEFEAAKLTAMLYCYNPPSVPAVAVERGLDMWLTNPRTRRKSQVIFLRGKLDGIVIIDGERAVLEHKSTSDTIIGFGPYWQRLSVDPQLSAYMALTGCKKAVYDVLRKPGLRPAAGETPDEFQARCQKKIEDSPEEYFQWRMIHKTEDEVKDGQEDLWRWGQRLRLSFKNDDWPRNGDACRGLYGQCPYLGVCTGSELITDNTLFRTKSTPNEELDRLAEKAD